MLKVALVVLLVRLSRSTTIVGHQPTTMVAAVVVNFLESGVQPQMLVVTVAMEMVLEETVVNQPSQVAGAVAGALLVDKALVSSVLLRELVLAAKLLITASLTPTHLLIMEQFTEQHNGYQVVL
jgi:hypothetical protein